MKHFCARILAMFVKPCLTNINISSIRCSRERVSVEGGWGGRSIELFPPYRFFAMFCDGHENTAVSGMEEWYYSRLIQQRLFDVPKSEGGMYGGSLFRLVASLHSDNGIELASDFSNANNDLIAEAIRQRVSQRFDLLKSIRSNGNLYIGDFISATKKENCYILKNGHHRVAAFAACGFSSIPIAISCLTFIRYASLLSRRLSLQLCSKNGTF
ncbi:hypothetical protein H8D64_01295 [PVC group bacterium]|nr:hypothetical protein [PVC group bacterium]